MNVTTKFLYVLFIFLSASNYVNAQSIRHIDTTIINIQSFTSSKIRNVLKPQFIKGNTQQISICENNPPFQLDSLLSVKDSVHGTIVHWNLLAAPINGTALTNYAIFGTGDTITPFNLFYFPNIGYIGYDSFQVTVSDSFFIDTVLFNVFIDSLPAISKITGADGICIGNYTTLYDSITGGNWFSKNDSIATIDSTGKFISYKAGTDTIFYSTKNGGCISIASKIVSVYDTPAISNIYGIDSICVGSAMLLYDSSGGGNWSRSNANVNIIGRILTGLTAGLDTITYTISNICGTVSTTTGVTILPLPWVDSISGPQFLCVNDTIRYSGSYLGDYAIWNTADSNIASVNDTGKVIALENGSVSLVYTSYNYCGMFSTTKNLSILMPPTAISVSGPENVCIGERIILTPTIYGGIWKSINNFADVVIDSGIVTGNQTGLDTIIYVIENICGSDSAVVPIPVMQKPAQPIIYRRGNLLFTDSVDSKYQWSLNGTNIQGAIFDTLTIQNSGIYEVWVENINKCRTLSSFFNVSTIYPCKTSDLLIFPNPFNNYIEISWCTYFHARVTTIEGKIITEFENEKIKDLIFLPAGCYILEIFDENGLKIKTQLLNKI